MCTYEIRFPASFDWLIDLSVAANKKVKIRSGSCAELDRNWYKTNLFLVLIVIRRKNTILFIWTALQYQPITRFSMTIETRTSENQFLLTEQKLNLKKTFYYFRHCSSIFDSWKPFLWDKCGFCAFREKTCRISRFAGNFWKLEPSEIPCKEINKAQAWYLRRPYCFASLILWISFPSCVHQTSDVENYQRISVEEALLCTT